MQLLVYLKINPFIQFKNQAFFVISRKNVFAVLEQKKLPEQFGSMHPSLGGYEQGLHCN
jgi:hypothetical protein